MRTDLPKEAVKINGNFIEDQLTGYKTVRTENREALPIELTTDSNGTADGDRLVGARYPQKVITVHFYLKGTSLSNVRSRTNTLSKLLAYKQPVEIIFNDEDDKFYKGIPVFQEEISECKDAFQGEFQIVCLDPFKYSTTEYSVNATNKQWSINYAGSYKGYPTFVTTFPNTEDANGDSTSTSECGYVGFVNQAGKILQFGDPEETDWADVQYPATVPFNKTFKSTTNWSTNSSRVLSGTQTGSVGISANHVYATGYGTGSGWHGPSISRIKTGETEPIAKNFKFTWDQSFNGNPGRFGGFEVLLWNNNSGTRTLVGGVLISHKTRDTKCKLWFYVGTEEQRGGFTVECSKIGAGSMKKVGKKITFNVGGQTHYYSHSSITDLIANEVTFHFMAWKSNNSLTANYVKKCKLQRFAFDNYENIPNTFMPGDVMTVRTSDANIFLDEGSATIPATYLGALGNDWEDFALIPGTNTIEADYSDFTTSPPTFAIKYRERFL